MFVYKIYEDMDMKMNRFSLCSGCQSAIEEVGGFVEFLKASSSFLTQSPADPGGFTSNTISESF